MNKSHLVDSNNSVLKINRTKSGSDIPNLISTIPLRDISTVLDVGCDTGENTQLLSTLMPNAKIIGVDKSKERIAYASNNFACESINFTCKDFEAQPIVGKFDLICFFTVMHWFTDVAASLRRAKTLLSKNGFILIVSVTKGTLRKTIDDVRDSSKWSEYFQNYKSEKNHVSMDELVSAAQKMGLDKIYSNTLEQKVTFDDKVSAAYSMAKWLEGLEKIPLKNREEFLLEIVDTYLQRSKKNKISLEFPAFELILHFSEAGSCIF